VTPRLTLAERRVALGVIAIAVALYVLVLGLIPARYPGSDEAKYLGIGLNFVAGKGPITAFGAFFQPHSPLWPAVMAAPQAWFGVDAYAWAHVLNVVAGAIVLVLGAVIGWRIRPAAGALVIASLVGFPYVVELSRHVGLDMPVAALTLGYLVVGHRAIDAGTARWSIATGVLAAVGFLTKESLLPFVPVPFLAGLVAGAPVGRVARVIAWTLLVGLLGTAWWWLLFASETGSVYRLGTPAWTLAPIGLAVVVAILVGFSWDRIWGSPRFVVPRVSGRKVAWLLAALSALALGIFFDRARNLRGLSLVDPGQLAFYARTWLPQMGPLLAIGGIGALIDLGSRIAARRRPGPAVDELWLAQLCTLPLVPLVAAVGDVPRHLVAQGVILLAIGAGGWLWLLEAVVARPSPGRVAALAGAVVAAMVCLAPLATINTRVTTISLVGLLLGAVVVAAVLVRPVTRGRVVAWLGQGGAAVGTMLLLLGAGTGVLATVAVLQGQSSLDERKASAVRLATDWLRTNASPGSTIALGGTLGMETAVELVGDRRLVSLREVGGLVDPRAPLGVADRWGRTNARDWISLGPTPQQASVLAGFRSSDLIRRLKTRAVDYWVLMSDEDDSPQRIVEPALTPDHGFTQVAGWTVANGGGSLRVVILRVDRAHLAFDPGVWTTEATLEGLVMALEAAAGPERATAARMLLERIHVEPEGPAADALRARLRALSGAASLVTTAAVPAP